MKASPWEDSTLIVSQADVLITVSWPFAPCGLFVSELVISYFPHSPSSAEFPEESVQFEKGRVKMNAVFQGIQRDNDIITPITP